MSDRNRLCWGINQIVMLIGLGKEISGQAAAPGGGADVLQKVLRLTAFAQDDRRDSRSGRE